MLIKEEAIAMTQLIIPWYNFDEEGGGGDRMCLSYVLKR